MQSLEQRLALIAADYAALYRELARLHLLTPHELNIHSFQTVFDRLHLEYLHYAGSTATQPFHRDVIENVLQLAAAYLSLPTEASPNSRAFGMYLLFFMYATQPTIDTTPIKVRISLGTLQNYVADATATSSSSSSSSYNNNNNNSNNSVCEHFGSCVTAGERQLMLTLHQTGAWHIVPFDDIAPYVRTLLEVHEAEGVPLITKSRSNPKEKNKQRKGQLVLLESVGTSNDKTALSQQLEAYEAMKRRLGLDKELA
ncbi:small nuclear RNA activating protein 3 [Trypanosoma theileri]|uniref:Small nuclear RNA activating protein 3 n=1 Tax=Trypanosoma theileri TaxID=67003 RepID=A0A1X0P7R5_9TRYP|nr:small nuclear RNA activating protein 3 [Trypanosoma theileri]ORC92918.1 small nuclear RNA activating protein 3 [Trypanosoma theileri]